MALGFDTQVVSYNFDYKIDSAHRTASEKSKSNDKLVVLDRPCPKEFVPQGLSQVVIRFPGPGAIIYAQAEVAKAK